MVIATSHLFSRTTPTVYGYVLGLFYLYDQRLSDLRHAMVFLLSLSRSPTVLRRHHLLLYYLFFYFRYYYHYYRGSCCHVLRFKIHVIKYTRRFVARKCFFMDYYIASRVLREIVCVWVRFFLSSSLYSKNIYI